METDKKESITKELIKQTIESGEGFQFNFHNKDIIVIQHSNDEHFPVEGNIDLIEIIYGNYNEDSKEDEPSYSIYGGEFFPVDKLNEAIDVFIERLNSETPMKYSGKSYKPQDIKVYNTKVVFYDNHYDYLNRILKYFWLEVFGKTPSEMWHGGIVSSHGDKCYGYRGKWKEHGINHNRGSLLFLLTYTKEFGDNQKHLSDQWVIDNYKKYLPAIEKAEALLLENIFTQKEGDY